MRKLHKRPPFVPFLFVSLCVYKRWIIADSTFPSNGWEWLIVFAGLVEIGFFSLYALEYWKSRPKILCECDLRVSINHGKSLPAKLLFAGLHYLGGEKSVSFRCFWVFMKSNNEIHQKSFPLEVPLTVSPSEPQKKHNLNEMVIPPGSSVVAFAFESVQKKLYFSELPKSSWSQRRALKKIVRKLNKSNYKLVEHLIESHL